MRRARPRGRRQGSPGLAVGDRDIAVGNLLGSSVYNIALILGITVLAVTGSGASKAARSSVRISAISAG